MIKSVWLNDLIIRLLNDPSSPLAQSFNVVSSFTGSKEGIMCLYEPDLKEQTYYSISSKTSFISSKSDIQIDDELINRVIEKKEIINDGEICLAPMWFENVSTFGYLYFKSNIKEENIEKFKQALLAFSYLLYSESLGSIIKSYHNTILKAENLCIDYKSGKITNRVVHNVNLSINEKEFTMIFGPSGSGKSSILNVLGGMLSASEGKVYYKDQEITNFSDKEKTNYRCNSIGFIFQKYNLINTLTVEENIKIAASLVKNPLPIDEVLKMVNLIDKKKCYPSQLSGGEQQRVCIARALAKRSEVLLCDEPTGALDSDNANQIIKILQDISKEKGIPVVVITHNPSLVVLADHYFTIENGRINDDVLQPFALRIEEITK